MDVAGGVGAEDGTVSLDQQVNAMDALPGVLGAIDTTPTLTVCWKALHATS